MCALLAELQAALPTPAHAAGTASGAAPDTPTPHGEPGAAASTGPTGLICATGNKGSNSRAAHTGHPGTGTGVAASDTRTPPAGLAGASASGEAFGASVTTALAEAHAQTITPRASAVAEAPAAAPALPGAGPAGLQTAASSPVATGGTAEARLAAPPVSADFAPQLGVQISTFARNGIEHARLHLNPADMGPVMVQIQLDGQTAQIHMSADHAATRQALEQAMPALASSLREAGLTLAGGGVFEQAQQAQDQAQSHQRRGTPGGAPPPGSAPGAPGAAGTDAGDSPALLRRRGVVDLVA